MYRRWSRIFVPLHLSVSETTRSPNRGIDRNVGNWKQGLILVVCLELEHDVHADAHLGDSARTEYIAKWNHSPADGRRRLTRGNVLGPKHAIIGVVEQAEAGRLEDAGGHRPLCGRQRASKAVWRAERMVLGTTPPLCGQ